jgi:HEAT repeat protein
LEKALSDPEPQVIAAAANALGRLGRVTALSKLEPKVPQVTAEVGGALLRNGDAKGMDLLRLAFIDRREESRLAALQAAQQAKEPSFAREALADEGSRVIQRAAAFSLASFGEDAGLAVLNRALGEDPASAGLARLALWELNRPEAAEFSPDKLWPTAPLALRVRLVDDAGRLPPKDAASLLRAGLASPDLGLRRAAMLALQSGESKLAEQAARLYFLALEDISPDIYTAAALAIARRQAAK